MREGRGGEEKLGKLEGDREASGILVKLTSAEGPYCLSSDHRDVCAAAPNQQRPFVYHERALCSSRRGTTSVDRLCLIMLESLVDQRRGGALGAKNQRSTGIRWRTTGKLRLTRSAAETSEDRRCWIRTSLSISEAWERLMKAVKVRKDGVPGINQDTPVFPILARQEVHCLIGSLMQCSLFRAVRLMRHEAEKKLSGVAG